MEVRKYRAKTLPQLLGVIDNVQKYTESEWVYGYYAPTHLFEQNGESKNNYAIISDEIVGTLEMLGCGVHSGLPKAYPIIENTLGQSTGFYDKNRKEVFEGDIFQDEDATMLVEFRDGCFKLISYGWFEYCLDGSAYEDRFGELCEEPMYNYDIESMGIIGNKYDNPNLLVEPEREY